MKIKWLGFLALIASGTALATDLTCIGRIASVANHIPDGLYVVQEGASIQPIKLCSFTTTIYQTSPESCKFIASMALTAYTTKVPVEIVVDNINVTACSAIPAWATVNLRFFQLMPAS